MSSMKKTQLKMKKLEKLTNHEVAKTSIVWGGKQDDPTCYTLTENKNMSEAGYCDTVFKVDSAQTGGGSTK